MEFLNFLKPLLAPLSHDPIVALSVLVAALCGYGLWSQSRRHTETLRLKDARYDQLRSDMQKNLDVANEQLGKLNTDFAEANKAGSDNLNKMADALARVAHTLAGMD